MTDLSSPSTRTKLKGELELRSCKWGLPSPVVLLGLMRRWERLSHSRESCRFILNLNLFQTLQTALTKVLHIKNGTILVETYDYEMRVDSLSTIVIRQVKYIQAVE